jgi:hypothetical protein
VCRSALGLVFHVDIVFSSSVHCSMLGEYVLYLGREPVLRTSRMHIGTISVC